MASTAYCARCKQVVETTMRGGVTTCKVCGRSWGTSPPRWKRRGW